ncbi:MAG TPA: hypothetical protein VE596_17840 [Gaiellaceae bacterium]|nr:hypothetical protein [Gaiellaceae bacterium]
MGAAVSALAGFVFLVLAAADFLLGDGVLAFFALPLAIVLEVAATYSAVRALGRETGARRGAALGAIVVAPTVTVGAAFGFIILFAPKQ